MMMEYLILTRLDKISRQIRKLNRKVNAMSETILELTSRVEALETVGDSAIALLNGLKAQLDAAIANNDMSEVKALSDRIGAQTVEMAEAIVANTVAVDEPPIEPVPVDPVV